MTERATYSGSFPLITFFVVSLLRTHAPSLTFSEGS